MRSRFLSALATAALTVGSVVGVGGLAAQADTPYTVTVSGRAVDAFTGKPLAHRVVGDITSQAERSSDETDAQGRFSLVTVLAQPTERHVLRFFDAASGYSTRTITVSSSTPRLDLGTLRTSVSAFVRGRLLTASGTPAAGATAAVYTLSGALAQQQFPGLPSFAATTTTDRNGVFSLPDLRPGRYRVGFSFNYTPSFGTFAHLSETSFFWTSSAGTGTFSKAGVITVQPSSSTHRSAVFSRTVRMPRGATIDGRVTVMQEDALYLEFQPVPANPKAAGAVVQTAARVVSTSGSGGVRFVSGALPPGRYRVVAPGYALSSSGQVLGYRDFSWTGDGHRPTTTPSKARLVTITAATRLVHLGVFDTTK